jgi:hypothetical protein
MMSGWQGPEVGTGTQVRFARAVVLTKNEAFDACSTLADAERVLLRGRCVVEAARLAALFELVECRLADY